MHYSFSTRVLLWHREDAPEALPSHTPPASKILRAEEVSKAHVTPALTAGQRERGEGPQIDRRQERAEASSLSDQCRDLDEEEQLRREGGIIRKTGKMIVVIVYGTPLKL